MMATLTRRRLTPERMDRPDIDRAELAVALRFIRHVNRYLGGSSALVRYLKREARHWPRRPIRLLDVGTGSADIPLDAVRWARRVGHDLRVVAVEVHPTTAALAREFVGDEPNVEVVETDARSLTDRFEVGSFDYAHAGMFLHHLPDIEVLTVLRMMDRLAQRAVIWNDLLRNAIGRLGSRALTMGAPADVRHDAIVSVEAGFTRREAVELARRAGLTAPRVRTRLGYRFVLIGEKPVW